MAVITDRAVMVEPVPEDEIAEEVHRGTGKGGQHQNKTDSAVRLRHLPTGITVDIQGRSQWQNRQRAREVLAERVAELRRAEVEGEVNAKRAAQIASAERGAKSWTWNEQRSEVVDHTTGERYRMKDMLKGRF